MSVEGEFPRRKWIMQTRMTIYIDGVDTSRYTAMDSLDVLEQIGD